MPVVVAGLPMPPRPLAAAADPQALRYRTTRCRAFAATGNCRYGPRCLYAHEDRHFRTEEQNLLDGLTSLEAITAYQRRGRLIAEKRKAEEASLRRAEERARALLQRAMRTQAGALYTHNPYAGARLVIADAARADAALC